MAGLHSTRSSPRLQESSSPEKSAGSPVSASAGADVGPSGRSRKAPGTHKGKSGKEAPTNPHGYIPAAKVHAIFRKHRKLQHELKLLCHCTVEDPLPMDEYPFPLSGEEDGVSPSCRVIQLPPGYQELEREILARRGLENMAELVEQPYALLKSYADLFHHLGSMNETGKVENVPTMASMMVMETLLWAMTALQDLRLLMSLQKEVAAPEPPPGS